MLGLAATLCLHAAAAHPEASLLPAVPGCKVAAEADNGIGGGCEGSCSGNFTCKLTDPTDPSAVL